MQSVREGSLEVQRDGIHCVGSPILGTTSVKPVAELQHDTRLNDSRNASRVADSDERSDHNPNITMDAEHEKEPGSEEEYSSNRCCNVQCCLVKCCKRSKKTGTCSVKDKNTVPGTSKTETEYETGTEYSKEEYGKGATCCAHCCCNRRYSCIWIVLLLVWIIWMLCWFFFGPLQVAERLKLASMDDKAFAASDGTRMADQLLYQAEDFDGYDFTGSLSREIPRVVHKVFITRGRKEDRESMTEGRGSKIKEESGEDDAQKFLQKANGRETDNARIENEKKSIETDELRRRKALINPYFSETSAMIMPLDMIDVVETWNQLATAGRPIEVRMYDLDGCRKYISEKLPVNSVLYRNVVQSLGKNVVAEYKENENNRILDAFDLLSAFAFKADLFRLLVLLTEGGVYSDVGDELRNADAMNEALWPSRTARNRNRKFRRNPDFLAFCDQRLTKNSERAKNSKTRVQSGNFQNTFIASVENFFVLHRAVRLVLWNVTKRKSNLDQLAITGPKVLGRALGFTEEQYYSPDRDEQYQTVFKKTDGSSNGSDRIVSVPMSHDNENPIGSSILLGSIGGGETLNLPIDDSRERTLVRKAHPDWSKMKGNSYAHLWWAGATFCSSNPTKHGIWCSIMSMFFTF